MNRDSYLIFEAYREILNEALPGVNPELEKDVIIIALGELIDKTISKQA